MPNSSTGYRRPLLTKAIAASLDVLARTTPATDETEAGLRYIRALVAHERRPEILAKRKASTEAVREYKRKLDPAIGTRRRGRLPKSLPIEMTPAQRETVIQESWLGWKADAQRFAGQCYDETQAMSWQAAGRTAVDYARHAIKEKEESPMK